MQNSGNQGNMALDMSMPPSHVPQPHMYGGASAVASQPNSVQRPAFAPAPGDSALALRIIKLAEYTARNGPVFEAQVRAKQAGSQEYSFLSGGEGTDFYRWCLFCMQRHIPYHLPLPDNWVDSGPVAAATQAVPAHPGPAHAAAAEHPQVHMQQHTQHPHAAIPPAGPMAAHMQPPMQSAQPAHVQQPGFSPPPFQQQMPQGMAPAMIPGHPAQPSAQPSIPGAISPDVASGFAQVLHVLQGSQDSIKSSSSWFLACRGEAAGLANMMLHRVQQMPDFSAQLHVLYLINDILFATQGEQPPQQPDVAAVFKPMLPDLFTAAYRTAACSQEAFTQLTGLLDLWSSRGIFNLATSATVRARMLDVGAPASVPIPSPAMPGPAGGPPHFPPGAGGPQGWAPPAAAMHMGAPQHPGAGFAPHPGMPGPAGPGGMRWGAAPPMGGPGPTGPPPGMLHPHAAPMGPPHGAPVPAVEPEKEPYNILSFPAGLIPKLTRNHLKYEKEYAPLLQDDIDSEPPPRRPVRDSYMQSRLERFYAELAQFQPGQARGAYEERLATLGDGLLPPNVHREPDAGGLAVSAETNMRSDGTYAGPDIGRGGLGVHAAGDPDDPYAEYRRRRSGRYHSIMASKSTNPNRPPMGH